MINDTLTAVRRAVALLHDRPHMAVIYVTGAGAGLQFMLWDVAGASRTILEAAFPYHPQALEDILGRKPEKSCCRDTAVLMAGAAYARAMEIAQKNGVSVPLLGLGLTGAVSTDRERKGADRVFVAVKTGSRVFTEEMEFAKGTMDRGQEGFCVDFLGLNMLLLAADLEPVPAPYPGKAEPKPVLGDIGDPLERLFWECGLAGTAKDLDPAKHILYPGSFNPLHYGHIALARQVERMTGKRAVFHITGEHPEKGKIPSADIERRVRQFTGFSPVLITGGDPLYVDKASRFPGFAFIIGADAVQAMLDPSYYDDPVDLPFMGRKLRLLGTSFYVAGRRVDGQFISAEKAIPASYKDMFIPIPGRWDVQSRDLRR